MKAILIIIGICCVGIIFSKSLLYVFDKICYNLLDYLIQKGGPKTQKFISKILRA